MSERTWSEVGGLIKARRLELGLTQEDASRDGGVSVATWRLLELGGRDRYLDLTLVGVARALRWPVDAVVRLLAGDDPADLPSVPSPADRAAQHAHDPTSGLTRKWSELTPEEQARVEAFIDGILSGRR